MKKVGLFLLFMLVTAVMGCTEKDEIVIIHTSYGDMKLVLFDETPRHKKNFLSLAREGKYDETIFHRVIKNFMIQGGDITLKSEGAKVEEYTLPAEFVPKYFHRRGAVAAARLGDAANPRKQSSGFQFYIVQGRKLGDGEALQARVGEPLYGLRQKIYRTEGGTPHLDDEYTVFGRVVEGLAVMDSISAVQTGAADKPIQDVSMTMEVEKVSRKSLMEAYGEDYTQ